MFYMELLWINYIFLLLHCQYEWKFLTFFSFATHVSLFNAPLLHIESKFYASCYKLKKKIQYFQIPARSVFSCTIRKRQSLQTRLLYRIWSRAIQVLCRLGRDVTKSHYPSRQCKPTTHVVFLISFNALEVKKETNEIVF